MLENGWLKCEFTNSLELIFLVSFQDPEVETETESEFKIAREQTSCDTFC